MWTHRILLEASQYQENAFVTLTYSDQEVPTTTSLSSSNILQTLNLRDYSSWLKRLRKAIAPSRIRFYCVGEYGDQTNRPHYHVALFGYPPCRYGISRYTKSRTSCCVSCDTVRDTWGKGNVLVGTLEPHSAQYIAGYVTKKMTRADDPRLDGRFPEFARMSNRPGIGAHALDDIASVLMTLGLDKSQADVPVSLRHGKKLLPLGRYLRRKLRARIGKDEKTPDEVLALAQAELQALYDSTLEVTSAPGMARFRSVVFRDKITDANSQKVANLEAKEKLRKKRGTI